MEHHDRLVEIAQDLGLLNETAQLCLIKARTEADNCELVLPLVGEFSAGKTTLINALTNSKQLETASKPTTATIYEIHFGCDTCYAEVYDESGEKRRVDDISSLKNDALADASVVSVYDTATRIPSGIILVDTPGLSSTDARHKQTLVNFLPQADGILLVVDVNQQITRSLTDFVQTMQLAKRPVFLIISKCDTKATSDVEAMMQNIANSCKLPIRNIACVSATKGDTDQLYQLLEAIQKEKAQILAKVNEQRVKDIVKVMLNKTDELLQASSSDTQLTESIHDKEQELRKTSRAIDHLIESSRQDIEDVKRAVVRKFQDNVFTRLDRIVANKSDNYNNEAVNAINAVASICLNDFRNGAKQTIAQKAREGQNSIESISLQALESIDLSELQMSGLTFNLDLNSIGHEYDGMISTGVKVAAAVAAVAVVASTGGTAAGAASGAAGTAGAVGAASEAAGIAATAAEVTLDAGGVIEAVDIATDIGSIISNEKHISRFQKTIGYASKAAEQYEHINTMNTSAGQQMGQERGLVEGMVGFVTDKLSKPQRRRAINIFIDETLVPEFRSTIENCERATIETLRQALQEEARVTIEEMRMALSQLRKQQKEQADAFAQRLEAIRDYKNELLTI